MGNLRRHMPNTERKRPKINMPGYRFTGKVHLPADPGWRDIARQKDVLVIDNAPDALFGGVMRQLINTIMENLSIDDSNALTFGLILNLIQGFPVEIRQAFVQAIMDGSVMTLLLKEGQIIGDLSPAVDAFNLGTGERRAPSGLILPG